MRTPPPDPLHPPEAPTSERSRPGVGAVVLAAGASVRMAGANKLLADLHGRTVVEHVVRTALEAGTDPVVVVTGHEASAVREALSGYPVELLENPRWAEGMGTSVAAGASALEGRVAGVLICLGDMPRVVAEDLRALMDAFASDRPDPAAAYVPEHGGRRGNPVLWSASWLPELCRLTGDQGARALLRDAGVRVVPVAAGAGVLIDADTPVALESLRRPDWRSR
jgi:molybdenum cofactor cytidylyltransferase